MPTTTPIPTTERSGRGKCFCAHCKKQGFRRSELSDTWLCSACRDIPGVRGYADPNTRGIRAGSPAWWKDHEKQIERKVIRDDDDDAPIAKTSPPHRGHGQQREVVEEATGDELDNKHRRFLEWTTAHSNLLAAKRNVCRAILLHQGAKGLPGPNKKGETIDRKGTPCTTSYTTLARETGLSKVRFRALLHALIHEGHVHHEGGPGARKLWVTMQYDAESVKPLRAWWKQSVGNDEAGTRAPVNRFFWLRTLARHRRLPHHAVVIGVAAVVDLLMNSHGRPYHWTTRREIAQLSGYSERHVHLALNTLEKVLGALEIIRQHGPGGGLLIFLREMAKGVPCKK